MLCDSCSKALQKPLVCAQCKTATYRHLFQGLPGEHTENGAGRLAIKVIDYSNAHTNTNVTE